MEKEDQQVEKLALLKEIESHNIAIYFRAKQKIEKAYGITKVCDVLLLHMDNSQKFVETINNALQHNR